MQPSILSRSSILSLKLGLLVLTPTTPPLRRIVTKGAMARRMEVTGVPNFFESSDKLAPAVYKRTNSLEFCMSTVNVRRCLLSTGNCRMRAEKICQGHEDGVIEQCALDLIPDDLRDR